MITRNVLGGKPFAGRNHIWVGEEKFISAAKPRQRFLLNKQKLLTLVTIMIAMVTYAGTTYSRTGQMVIDGRTFDYTYTWWSAGSPSNVTITAISPTAGEVTIPELIENAPVIAIPSFENDGEVTRVNLPTNITSIGCFAGCTNLTYINLDHVLSFGYHAFAGCSKLDTQVHVRKNTRWLTGSNWGENGAFLNCTSLTNLVFDSDVENIGSESGWGMFKGCGIKYLRFPPALKWIDQHVFEGCDLREVVFPDNPIRFNLGSSFANCTNLHRVVYGNGMTQTGQQAFEGCTKLSEVVLSPTIEVIDVSSFSGCRSLTYIDIPNSVTNIGYAAFRNAGLMEVVVPGTVTTVGTYVFAGCPLRSVRLPEGLRSISNGMFSDCTNLTSVAIPDGVTKIGEYAFSRCASLTSLDIPDSVTDIGGGFTGTGLTEIRIPDKVTVISEQAFYNCTNLTHIVLGRGIRSIYSNAFYHWRNMPKRKITALCAYPTGTSMGADWLIRSFMDEVGNSWDRTGQFAIVEEQLSSWVSWLIKNNLNYTVLNETTGEEARVVLGEGGTNTVGIAAALGLSPARTTDAGGAVATYAMPKLSIESFDPSEGRVDVKVTPVEGGTVSADPVVSCIGVYGSNDLKTWWRMRASVDTGGYRGTGAFSCTFNPSAYRFYKVTVIPAWAR